MDYTKRWEIIQELNQGGQGKVYKVLDKDRFHSKENLQKMIESSISKFSRIHDEQMREDAFDYFKTVVIDLIKIENPSHYGALKVLHKPELARDSKRAEERIKREIEAMSKISHPNLLKIFDYDADSKWFVSQFYSKGTLNQNLKFIGNFPKALKSFRPLVEGVSKLHENKIVHRDIKPQNVFIDYEDNLVLGDFGLIFFEDETHTRISATLENVGSRDWMPAWAQGIRIEDIKPSFDVFSLGKVLWSMISGKSILQLWYFKRDLFNVERLFPKNYMMTKANWLLERCITEEEKDCLPNAKALLEEVDRFLSLIELNTDIVSLDIKRRCKVCGLGNYQQIVERGNRAHLEAFGIHPNMGAPYKIFTCDYCGHVQLFDVGDLREALPPAWKT